MGLGTEERGVIDFLSGGGAMGAWIRAFDWAPTYLGPISVLPQIVRTAVSL